MLCFGSDATKLFPRVHHGSDLTHKRSRHVELFVDDQTRNFLTVSPPAEARLAFIQFEIVALDQSSQSFADNQRTFLAIVKVCKRVGKPSRAGRNGYVISVTSVATSKFPAKPAELAV
ncbi:hypothetical protein UNPA324_06410 [Bradyrhizobium sp. UNPA324]|nr:hypothetical protein UNPA324_06410 [Bradyrhizobium sp. UNPA324]